MGEFSSPLQHRIKDGNTPSRGLGGRGEVSPESEEASERGSVSERASTSNGEFCLLTDGRRREGEREGGGKGRGGLEKKALLPRFVRHGSMGEGGRDGDGEAEGGRAERRRDKSNRDWSESRRSCLPAERAA